MLTLSARVWVVSMLRFSRGPSFPWTTLPHSENNAHVEWLRSNVVIAPLGSNSSNNSGTDELSLSLRLDRAPPWTILNTPRGASGKEVKAQFRTLSRHLHPDKQKRSDAQAKQEAHLLFPLLQKAYDGLKNEATAEAFRQEAEVDEAVLAKTSIYGGLGSKVDSYFWLKSTALTSRPQIHF